MSEEFVRLKSLEEARDAYQNNIPVYYLTIGREYGGRIAWINEQIPLPPVRFVGKRIDSTTKIPIPRGEELEAHVKPQDLFIRRL